MPKSKECIVGREVDRHKDVCDASFIPLRAVELWSDEAELRELDLRGILELENAGKQAEI